MITEAEKRYRKTVKRINVDLYQSDTDIIEWAEKRKGFLATRVKHLIREDIRSFQGQTQGERSITAEVESLSFSLTPTGRKLNLSLKGCPYPFEVDVCDIHYGGENCEMKNIRIGSIVRFDYNIGMGGCRCVLNLIITKE